MKYRKISAAAAAVLLAASVCTASVAASEEPVETTAEETVAAEDIAAADVEDDDTDEDELTALLLESLEEAYSSITGYTADDVNDNGYFRILSDANSGEAALFNQNNIAVLAVYGVRYTVKFDPDEVANDDIWIGGGIGANSESTGWEAHEWGKASGNKEITPDFENGIIEWLDTEPVFSPDDTYAHLWLQTWGGNVKIIQIDILGEGGMVLGSTTPAETEEVEDTPVLISPEPDPEPAPDIAEAPATVTGSVMGDSETGKASPDTGIADAAAAAGIAVAAAGAFVIARKRK